MVWEVGSGQEEIKGEGRRERGERDKKNFRYEVDSSFKNFQK